MPGGDAAARARHPARGEHRHVRPLLELQGRPGPRALPHAAPRAAGRPERDAMLSTHLGPSGDLPPWARRLAVFVLAVASFLMLLVEMRRRERGGVLIALTGLLADRRAARGGRAAGARVGAGERGRRARRGARRTRRARWRSRIGRRRALAGARRRPSRRSRRRRRDARLHGPRLRRRARAAPARAIDRAARAADDGAPRSDLGAALRALAASAEERPAAVVVVSDGRLDDPPEDASEREPAARSARRSTSRSTPSRRRRRSPADASVRRVSAAGAAVAHVPLPLRVEVGCAGGLACDELTVTARELRDDGPPGAARVGHRARRRTARPRST